VLGPIIATVNLTTEADSHAVWRALETAARWPEVLSDLASARVEPTGPLTASSTIRTQPRSGSNMIEMVYRVVAAEAPQRLVLTSSAAGFFAETEYAIASDGEGGASVTVTARVVAERPMMRLMTTIWRSRYREHIATSLRRRMGSWLMLAETMARESRSIGP
jgi:hypothetical protein